MVYKHFVTLYPHVFIHNFLISRIHHSLAANLVNIDGINCFGAKTFIGKIFSVF